jgi:hypothetical protein
MSLSLLCSRIRRNRMEDQHRDLPCVRECLGLLPWLPR